MPHADALPLPLFLKASCNPERALAQLFHQLRERLPLDGILVGFMDNATFTTYWLSHQSLEEGPAVPCAVVHTGAEIRDLVDHSTWDREGNWVRIVNDPQKIVVGKFFADHMRSDSFSLIHVRSTYDASKRGQFILYTRGKGVYTQAHMEIIAACEQAIMLLTSVFIKDFQLQRLHMARVVPERETDTDMENDVYDLVAVSPAMRNIVQKLERVSQFPSPVLLTGETGVGKEMLADFIHFHSPRRKGPFVKINCGAIPPTLLDSELFGHEKGAFTGAVSQKTGCFERANAGTLLLDELGEMPLNVQVRLLRVLQSGTFERIGGSRTLHTNVRLIAATNRDMGELLRNGAFREDLFYRLNVYAVRIPPLRERQEDLSLLVRIILRNTAKKLRITTQPIVRQENISALARYSWRGNVRELQNAIESSLINYTISPSAGEFWIAPDVTHYDAPENAGREETLPAPSLPPCPDECAGTFDDSVREILTETLRRCAGKIHGKEGAAARLGLKPSTLWGKLNKYGIRPEPFQNRPPRAS